MRGANIGTSRSRYERMKSVRHARLSAAPGAIRLSGKPPRTHSSPLSIPAAAASRTPTASISTCAIRPARLSEGLPHEVERGGPEQQKVTGAVSGRAPVIDHAAQGLEQTGGSVHLVDYAQPATRGSQIGVRVLELAAVGGPFEIDVERAGAEPAGDGAGERRLAYLPRPEQRHGGACTVAGPEPRIPRREVHVPSKSNTLRWIYLILHRGTNAHYAADRARTPAGCAGRTRRHRILPARAIPDVRGRVARAGHGNTIRIAPHGIPHGTERVRDSVTLHERSHDVG